MLLWDTIATRGIAPTGLSPSTDTTFQTTSVSAPGRQHGPTTPHPRTVTRADSVCPLPLSIASSDGIAFAFFSSPY